MTDTDTLDALLHRMGLGDRDAFEALYHQTAPRLYGLCLRLLGDDAEAGQALKATYVHVWDAAVSHRPGGHADPWSWLVTITRNRALERLRRRGPAVSDTDPIDLTEDSPGGATPRGPNPGRTPISACLASLPEDRAEMLRRAYLAGTTYAELAADEGVPVETLRGWMRRSLQQLAGCLAKTTGPDDPNGAIALAGEYALGLLPEDEARLVAHRLGEDPALADTVRDWDAQLAGLADGIAPENPPTRVLQAIRADLFAEQDQPWWQKLGLVQAILGAAAAAALALAAVQFGWLGPAVPEASHQARLAAPDRGLVVAILYFEDQGVLRVDRQAGSLPPGRALQLWLSAPGQAPVSLGLLPPGREALLQLPEALRPAVVAGTLFVTDEPAGGAPGGTPTGDRLASAPVAGVTAGQ